MYDFFMLAIMAKCANMQKFQCLTTHCLWNGWKETLRNDNYET